MDFKCQHPDHVDGESCLDRAVGCHKDCRCCMHFTEEEVIALAKKKYGKPVCVDHLSDAMMCDTLEEAAQTLIDDSVYWDESPNL